METNYFRNLFEDDYLIVVNKKSGLLAVPSPKREKNTLTSLLNDYLRNKNEKAFPCHRLDRETSGLVIYAKNRKAQQNIMGQFRHHLIKKKYLARKTSKIKEIPGSIKRLY